MTLTFGVWYRGYQIDSHTPGFLIAAMGWPLIRQGGHVLPTELAQYLHTHIPLSRAMDVSVVAVDPNGVTLDAPLEPNINHHQTVFGGSASALAILAGWALLHVRLQAEGIASRLVIQRNVMEYERPILGRFRARATLQQPERWPHFTRMLARKGKARVAAFTVLEYMDQVVGKFTGEFVAFGTPGE